MQLPGFVQRITRGLRLNLAQTSPNLVPALTAPAALTIKPPSSAVDPIVTQHEPSNVLAETATAKVSGIDAGPIVVIEKRNPYDLWSLRGNYALCARAEAKSPAYVRLMLLVVGLFINHLTSASSPTDVRLITTEHIRLFIVHLQTRAVFAEHPYAKTQGKNLSAVTVNDYARTLRAFWSWLEKEGIIAENPFGKVTVPKAPARLITIPTPEQLQALLRQPDLTTSSGIRDRTMCEVFLDSMLRLSELCGAKMPDLNLERRELKVIGKGARERLVPLGRTAWKDLWKYINFHRPEPQLAQADYIFLTEDGRQLKKNRIEEKLREYGQRAGIENVRVTPHILRHAGATMFINNGGDQFALQRILGHSRLDTTSRYVNLTSQDVHNIHATASPLDNLVARQGV